MKNMPAQQGKKAMGQKPKHSRPENKDDLDSRANEEQDNKGDDITHNVKDTRSSKPGRDNARGDT